MKSEIEQIRDSMLGLGPSVLPTNTGPSAQQRAALNRAAAGRSYKYERHFNYLRDKKVAFDRSLKAKERAANAYRSNRISWPDLVAKRKEIDAQYEREKQALRRQHHTDHMPKSF